MDYDGLEEEPLGKLTRRAFADLKEGQVHYWTSRTATPDKLPLLVLHPGPGTARIQVPLLEV